ncbi:MAG: tetratricopeptide repeat protein [Thermodesulfobacteriota bacterium]
MQRAPDKPGGPGSSGREDDYRMAASSSLTRQGHELLQKDKYDRAIRVLERAVGVNPGDGRGYFYLAEAWIGKENLNQAARFNEMAILYLRDDPAWLQRARAQKERIEKRKQPE